MSFAKQLLLADVTYSAWANRRLLDGCSSIPAEELKRDLSISHTCVLNTLEHIYEGEKAWLLCVRDTPDFGTYVLPPPSTPRAALDDLKRNWPPLWEGYHRWLQDQSEKSLASEVTVQLPGAEPRFPRWKILRHMLDHSQFHRGQVVGMIRALGHTPPAINRMDSFFVGESDLFFGTSV